MSPISARERLNANKVETMVITITSLVESQRQELQSSRCRILLVMSGVTVVRKLADSDRKIHQSSMGMATWESMLSSSISLEMS